MGLKTNLMKQYLYLTFCLLLTACYSGQVDSERLHKERMSKFQLTDNGSLMFDESAAVQIETSKIEIEPARVSDFYVERRFISLKTPESIIIGEISRVRTNEDYLLILDAKFNKDAYLFDKEGNFLFTVGNHGNGPGEHDDVIDIALTDDSVFITDRSFSVFEYSTSNTFLSKAEIPFFSHSSYHFKNGVAAYSNNTTGFDDLSYQIISIGGDQITNRFIKNKGPVISRYTSQELSNNPAYHNDSFLFFEPWGREVFQMGKDKVSLRYQFITDTPIPEELFIDDKKFMAKVNINFPFIFISTEGIYSRGN